MKDDEYKGYYNPVQFECSGSQHNVRIRTRSSALPENPEKESSETVHKKAQGNRTGSGYESSS